MDANLTWRAGAAAPDRGEIAVALAGSLTERAALDALLAELAPYRRVVLDLSTITHVNSFGIKKWVQFIGALAEPPREVELARCSAAIVRQFDLVRGALGGARVRSFAVPYLCDECGATAMPYMEVGDDGRLVGAPPSGPRLPPRPCPECHGEMAFDDVEDEYLGFLGRR